MNKTTNFIGILYAGESVDRSLVGALAEVIRDFRHCSLKDITISVLTEEEILQTVSKKTVAETLSKTDKESGKQAKVLIAIYKDFPGALKLLPAEVQKAFLLYKRDQLDDANRNLIYDAITALIGNPKIEAVVRDRTSTEFVIALKSYKAYVEEKQA